MGFASIYLLYNECALYIPPPRGIPQIAYIELYNLTSQFRVCSLHNVVHFDIDSGRGNTRHSLTLRALSVCISLSLLWYHLP